jgi:uncharacterized membrane protein
MNNPPPNAPPPRPPHRGIAIEDASAWILRVGVVASVAVMLTGIVFSFIHHHVPLERMQHDRIDFQPRVIAAGVLHGQGKAIIEVGIYMLVLTPILRVFTSMVLFAFEEHDWLYTLITFVVLALTVCGLVLLK